MDTKEEITETDNITDDAIKKDKKSRKHRKIRTAIIIFEIILILFECAVLYVVNKLDRVQRVAISVDELQENISEEVKANAESGQMKGYTNIALFGVDTRTGDLETNLSIIQPRKLSLYLFSEILILILAMIHITRPTVPTHRVALHRLSICSI